MSETPTHVARGPAASTWSWSPWPVDIKIPHQAGNFMDIDLGIMNIYTRFEKLLRQSVILFQEAGLSHKAHLTWTSRP